MKTMKNTLAMMLFAATLLAAVSCGDENSVARTGTDALEGGSVDTQIKMETEENNGLDLPEVDYGGADFVIAFREIEDSIDDIAFDADNLNDVVEEAKYKRNLAVEEAVNVRIVPHLLQGDLYGNSPIKGIMAGDDIYALIAPHAHIAWSTYIVPGLAQSWTDVMMYNDFDAPWWDQDSRKSLSIGGEIYTMAGDFSYYSLGNSKGIVFNKKLFSDIGEDYPYQSVLDKTWDFEQFQRLAKLGVSDLNGDGTYDLTQDRFGYATNHWGGPIDFLYTSGARTTQKDENDIPHITLMDDRSVAIYEKFFSFVKEPGIELLNEDNANSQSITDAFVDGRLLFTEMRLLKLNLLRDMKDDWGIVPYPMMDASVGSYASNVDAGLHLYVLPITVEDTDRVSIVMERMSYEGYKTVIPAFYEQALQNKYARDETSIQMLDIIKASRVFDFGYFTNYNHNIGCAGYYLAHSTSQDLASYYAKNQSAGERGLKKMLEGLEID